MPTRKKAKPAARSTKKKAQARAAPRKPVSTAKKKKRAAPSSSSPAKRRAVHASGKHPGSKLLKKLPFLWKYKTGAQAVGLWVDELVWAANDHGEIFVLTKSGELERSYKLPGPVHCLLADEMWKYAGCNDGNVYDLTGRQPRAMYAVDGKAGIDWLEVYRGTLAVSDHEGGLTVIDVEGNLRWKKKDKKAGEGWMVRADGMGLYHGSEIGVRMFDWSGKKQWTVDTGDVRFGWQEADEVVVTGGFQRTYNTKLVVVGKDGRERLRRELEPNGPGFKLSGAESCAAGTDSNGNYRYFLSAGNYLFCWDKDGKQLWRGPTGCESACTMQLVGDVLYAVTANGTICSIDVSAEAIDRATKGNVSEVKTRKAAKVEDASREVERTTDASKGVVVECVKDGAKVRVRVVSDGYNHDWFVQFPRDLREEGARFVVDEVREATQGGFYRVLGDIKRLE